MMISKMSQFSGVRHIRQIDVTAEQMEDWKNGNAIQNAMPNISADDREFIMTGITPEEWSDTFGEE